MASFTSFGVDLRPKLISTNLSGPLAQLGETIGQIRTDREARDILADMKSNDPASVDEAIKKLIAVGGKWTDVAMQMQRDRVSTADKAEARDIARGQLDVARGGLDVRRSELKRGQEADTAAVEKDRQKQKLIEGILSGAGGAPAAVPAPPTQVRPDEDIGDDEPAIDISSANKPAVPLTPVTPIEPTPPLATDLSSAQKPAAPAAPGQSAANRFLSLTPDQLLGLIAATDDPSLRQAAALRRAELLKGTKDKKDPRLEGFEKKEGEATSKLVGEIRQKADVAREQQGLLQTQEDELRKYPTGTIAKWMQPINKFVASAANEMGKGISGPEGTGIGQLIDVARERARGVEILEGTTSDLLFRKLQGFGKGITNDERQVMRQIYAGIEKTTEGNLALTKMQMHANDIAVRERQRIDQYLQYRKSIGKAPLPEHIEKLRDIVQEQGAQELKQRAENDRRRFGLKRIHWPKEEGGEQKHRGVGESY